MKPLKRWSMLILIASALLLSAARSESPYPKPGKHQNHGQTEAENKYAAGGPIPSPVEQPHWDVRSDTSGKQTYQYYGTFNYVPPQPADTFWTRNAAAITGITAILVAFSSALLVYIGKQAANAAESSAAAARLALNAERPYVFVENQHLMLFWWKGSVSIQPATEQDEIPTHVEISFGFNLRNRGKGVAILKDVRLRLIDSAKISLDTGSPKVVGRSRVILRYGFFIQHGIIGANETSEEPFVTFGIKLPIDQWYAMNAGPQTPIIILRVAYQDVYGRTHHTTPVFRYFRTTMFLDPNRMMRRAERRAGRRPRIG